MTNKQKTLTGLIAIAIALGALIVLLPWWLLLILGGATVTAVALHLILHSKPKPQPTVSGGIIPYRDGMEYIFSDENGKRYYQFPSIVTMPANRFLALSVSTGVINMGIKPEDLTMFCAMIQEYAGSVLAGEKQVEQGKKLSVLNTTATEMINRVGNISLADESYYFRALGAICEDEDPKHIDTVYTQKKAELFKDMADRGVFINEVTGSREGSHWDFFTMTLIDALLRRLNMSDDDLTKHWRIKTATWAEIKRQWGIFKSGSAKVSESK